MLFVGARSCWARHGLFWRWHATFSIGSDQSRSQTVSCTYVQVASLRRTLHGVMVSPFPPHGFGGVTACERRQRRLIAHSFS